MREFLCVVEGNHDVTRQLWQKALQIGKSAMDLESLIDATNKIVKTLRDLHTKIQENLVEVEANALPNIKDKEVLSVMKTLASQQAPYMLIDLQGNDTEEAKASAKQLEESLEELRGCVNERGAGQMAMIANWIATLWAEEAQKGTLLVTPTTEPQEWLHTLETTCSSAIFCNFLWMYRTTQLESELHSYMVGPDETHCHTEPIF